MTFLSVSFLAFLAGGLVLFWTVPRRAQPAVLLLLSLGFALSWGLATFGVLVAAATATWAVAERLQRPGAELFLALGVGVNLVLLLGARELPGPFRAVGVSFVCLGLISYLVDRWRRQAPAATLLEVALYATYFPKLLAGPIERSRPFVETLRRSRTVDDAVVVRAVALFLLGAFRKAVLGDGLAALARVDGRPLPFFTAPGRFSAGELLVALLVSGFSLYNDFAGYSDMARGVSLLFGIELAPNFRSPFFSKGVAEFWTRWHISLSTWLRDYVYYPVSRGLLRRTGGRATFGAVVLPPLLTLAASGAWHGSRAHFVLWGVLTGALQAADSLYTARHRRAPAGSGAGAAVWGRAVVGVGLMWFALVLFQAPTIDRALAFWRRLSTLAPGAVVRISLLGCGWRILVSLLIDSLQARTGQETPFLSWPRAARLALAAGAVLAIVVASRSGMRPFVYQGF